MVSNKRVIYKKKLEEGFPEVNNFEVIEEELNLENVSLKEGEYALRNLYVSVDPYLRARFRENSFVPPFTLGDVLSSGGISEVIKSNDPNLKVGDVVIGFTGWEEYTIVRKDDKMLNAYGRRSLNEERNSGLPLSYYLSVLFSAGMTAYAGLKLGEPKEGETIYVSAAAGAVGSIVGQIAKIKGLRVVGSAGDDKKVDVLLNELKLDAAFNYKKTDIDKALKEYCPKGIDIYFDNVGGETLDIALNHMNYKGRITFSGMISQYNTTNKYGVKNLDQVIWKNLTIKGFIVRDYFSELYEQFRKDMGEWLKTGKLIFKEDIAFGIEKAPEAYVGLYHGKNIGKSLVKIGDL